MDLNFNFGIVINPIGPFGGAQRRFTNLLRYLYEKYPNNAYYFVSYDLFEKIKKIYPDYPLHNVMPIGKNEIYSDKITINNYSQLQFVDNNNSSQILFLRKLLNILGHIVFLFKSL